MAETDVRLKQQAVNELLKARSRLEFKDVSTKSTEK
jgi:hypothetical protein